MGAPWVDHPSFEVVAEASNAAGRDIAELLLAAPMEELTPTHNAQLATFVQSLVVLDAVERLGLSPAACAGHSLGEYTALVASGAMSFDDGVHLVVARGEAMTRAGEDAPGTMAALLGISDDDAEAACQRAEGDVWVANYNAPGQVVIAGTSDAVATASALAKDLGAKRVLPIPVSGAFHTPLMAGARAALRKALGDAVFLTPEVPVVANVDARVHVDPADWPGLLSAQLCSPVRWRQSLETLSGLGATTLVELGPGGVLTGLARRTLEGGEAVAIAVSTPDDLDKLAVALTGAEPFEAFSEAHAGERFFMTERLVVSPGTGLFQPIDELVSVTPGVRGAPRRETTDAEGPSPEPTAPPALGYIDVGTLIGHVGDREIRSAFAGMLEGVLVLPGERVVTGQPVAWVRPGAGRGDAA
jgi:[acyl-carrier-protein] S-malonyltransferase